MLAFAEITASPKMAFFLSQNHPIISLLYKTIYSPKLDSHLTVDDFVVICSHVAGGQPNIYMGK